MYPLFESIKVVDGEFLNLKWHQKRVDRSRKKVLGTAKALEMAAALAVPNQYQLGVVKCRVSYGHDIGPVVYSNYVKKAITTLQQVECEPFDYSAKYEDRSKLEQLYELRGSCDEVLITHHGIIADTSYSNVALSDGSKWYTPAKPLLEGTQRAKLLAAGTVNEAEIHISDLPKFKKLVLINAMLEFKPEDSIPVDQIRAWKGQKIVIL